MVSVQNEMLASNYVGGAWLPGKSGESMEVTNPATSEVLATFQLAQAEEVNQAVSAAAAAFPAWRRTPPQDRIQFLFRLKQLLEKHFEDIARTTTLENGKTLAEARAELQRGIENVEVACGIPTMMQGYNLEDVASGIDEIMIRQPLGVVAAITPFNFPAMIPLWFLPYAIACGNTFILKPSERVPLTARKIFELLHETGLPAGVVNLVAGAKPCRRRSAASPRRAGHQLCRFHSRGQIHLRRRLRARQARPVPGRREESRRRHAGCGSGDGREES